MAQIFLTADQGQVTQSQVECDESCDLSCHRTVLRCRRAQTQFQSD